MGIRIPSRSLACLLLAASVICNLAEAAGDAAKGALVYEEECSECHALSGKAKKGPSLWAIFGRQAGTVPGFDKYSEELKKSKLVWSVEEMDKYLARPKQYAIKVKMKYDGLPDARDRANLIAFLASKK